MYCAYCGKVLRDMDKTCPDCGKNIEWQRESNLNNEDNNIPDIDYSEVDCLWFCEQCKTNPVGEHTLVYTPWGGTFMRGGVTKNGYVCPDHKCLCKMIDMCGDDYLAITHASDDISFLEAMIELKEKDIVEYLAKMYPFRKALSQARKMQIAEYNAKPRCPYCRSVNIKPISELSKVLSAAVFGIFSKRINQNYHCNKCGRTW